MGITAVFQSCASCDTSFRVRSGLCPDCRSELMSRIEPMYWRQGREHDSYALLDWNGLNDNFVRPLVYSMKGGRNPELRRELVALLASRVAVEDVHDFEILIPPTSSHQANHAECVAKDLLACLGWKKDINSLRTFQPLTPLKNRTRSERKHLKFERNLRLGDKIVFIDDVITSGSTAQAAYEAMGKPQHFKIITLWSRAKLAESRSF